MTLSCQIKFYEETNCLEASVTRLRAFARYFHRSDYSWAKEQKYASSSGVYFLFGPCDEFPRRFYIGQAEIRQNDLLGIVNRMNEKTAHERINDWTDGLMFVCTDNYFNENPLRLRYLENHLWKEASGLHPFECSLPHAYQVVTRSEPRAGFVAEEDQETLDEFIQFCKLFLKLAGFPIYCSEAALVPQEFMKGINGIDATAEVTASENKAQVVPAISEKDSEKLSLSAKKECVMYYHTGKTQAKLYHLIATGDYVLCAGALLAPLTTATRRTKQLRHQYRHSIDRENRTTVDILFDSPNQAALFVCGRQSVSKNQFWKPAGKVNCPQRLGFKKSKVTYADNKVFDQNRIFFFREAKGRLEEDNKHFTVFAGSKMGLQASSSIGPNVIQLRTQNASKIQEGVLSEDISFESPSAAAQFVCLYSVSGNAVWKNADGISLGDFKKG